MADATVIITKVTLSKQVVSVGELLTISVDVAQIVPESVVKRLPLKLGRKGVVNT